MSNLPYIPRRPITEAITTAINQMHFAMLFEQVSDLEEKIDQDFAEFEEELRAAESSKEA